MKRYSSSRRGLSSARTRFLVPNEMIGDIRIRRHAESMHAGRVRIQQGTPASGFSCGIKKLRRSVRSTTLWWRVLLGMGPGVHCVHPALFKGHRSAVRYRPIAWLPLAFLQTAHHSRKSFDIFRVNHRSIRKQRMLRPVRIALPAHRTSPPSPGHSCLRNARESKKIRPAPSISKRKIKVNQAPKIPSTLMPGKKCSQRLRASPGFFRIPLPYPLFYFP
jgi:hypothetical protein